jgi:hypothetical protein
MSGKSMKPMLPRRMAGGKPKAYTPQMPRANIGRKGAPRRVNLGRKR